MSIIQAKKPVASLHSVRFLWNGIKVDESLIKVNYYLNSDGSLLICDESYTGLPCWLFTVRNNSDVYSDYYDNDKATIQKDDPLYRYAVHAYYKAKKHNIVHYIKVWEKRRRSMVSKSDYEALTQIERTLKECEDPGPVPETVLDLIDLHREQEAERIRKQQEDEREEARREYERQVFDGTETANYFRKRYPLQPGKASVLIGFSESPYLRTSRWTLFSLKAADKLLAYLDGIFPADAGYDKTDFYIFTDQPKEPEGGWEHASIDCAYKGRYDIGDREGGIIRHISSYADFYAEHGFTGSGPDDQSREHAQELREFITAITA